MEDNQKALLDETVNKNFSSSKCSCSFKSLLAIVILLLPLVGFYFGMKYQKFLDQKTILLTEESLAEINEVPMVLDSQQENKNSEIIDLDNTWQRYTNHQLGYSVNIPKKTMSGYGNCKYSTEDGDHSYRPVADTVPLQILESGSDVIIVPEYEYRFINETRENSRSYYADCEKTPITSEKVVDDPTYVKGPNLTFMSSEVPSDKELELFIKEKYGQDCELGNMTKSAQEGVYSVSIKGIVSDFAVRDCVVNYQYSIKYNPSINTVVAWNLGQGCNFSYPDYEQCLDFEMDASFRFN